MAGRAERATRKTRAKTRRIARTKKRLSDEDARQALRLQLEAAYKAGASIRDLATAHKLAFGTVRTLLLEAGVTLRARGGPNHTRRDAVDAPDTTSERG
jgi:Helix-turn-helix domain